MGKQCIGECVHFMMHCNIQLAFKRCCQKSDISVDTMGLPSIELNSLPSIELNSRPSIKQNSRPSIEPPRHAILECPYCITLPLTNIFVLPKFPSPPLQVPQCQLNRCHCPLIRRLPPPTLRHICLHIAWTRTVNQYLTSLPLLFFRNNFR